MKNSVASIAIPSWVNFNFTGKRGDLFAVSIPTVEKIIDFAYDKYVEDYRAWSSFDKKGDRAKVKAEVLFIQEILDHAVSKLTPLQRRGLLWGMVRNQYLFNIRHKLYERRGRDYVSIMVIGYNWLWKDYPEITPEGAFWNEVPASVELAPSKEYPKYY